jgi:hypothetical protein
VRAYASVSEVCGSIARLLFSRRCGIMRLSVEDEADRRRDHQHSGLNEVL